jgi:hypothetical protein
LAILLSSLHSTNPSAVFHGGDCPVGEPVFAVHRTSAGRWSIAAPCCRDLSGRIGVHRIAVLDEPAAAAGGAEVIRLEEARQDRLAGLAEPT